MVLVGLYVVLLAIPLEFIWFLKDYWNPLRYISVASFLYQESIFAFLLGGIVSVIYIVPIKDNSKFKLLNFILPIAIIALSMLIFTNGLRLNSIYSSQIGYGITTLMIFDLKPELIKKSLLSGFSMLVISIIGYEIILIIYPHLINDWWLVKNISGLILFGIPIEEIIWFALFGLSFGPIYNFWTESL
ncbi:MAG: lycopene cyclase domain-containing protein [Desulfobaccales bacterium]